MVGVVGGCGGFFFFFVVAVDLVGGGDGGWMWWPSVLRIVGLRKRETNERERIKNE